MSLSSVVACAAGRLRDQVYKINSYTKLANPGLLLASARRCTPSLAAIYTLQGLWCQSASGSAGGGGHAGAGE